MHKLVLSDYVTLVVIVPQSHADVMRQVLSEAGAGRFGKYEACTFSVQGVGRYVPSKDANPCIGSESVLETVVEEKIETICHRDGLEAVIDAIKIAHPYEETVIDIFPIYHIGCKITQK